MRMKSSVVVVIVVVVTGIVVASVLKSKLSRQKSEERTPNTAAKVSKPRSPEGFDADLAQRLKVISSRAGRSYVLNSILISSLLST